MSKNKDQSKLIAKKNKKWKSTDLELVILGLPTFLYFLLFMYLPLPGLLLAFKNYRPKPGHNFFYSLFTSNWASLKNFEVLFRTPDAPKMIFNTLFYNVIGIMLGAILPVALAMMLSQLRSKKVMKTTQTMMFLPHFLSWVVVSNIVYAFLAPNRGYVNNVLLANSSKQIDWYNTPQYWRFILIFMNQWKSIGYTSIIYMSAITSIDNSLYEAAMIDGATKLQQARYITVPHLRRTISVMLIMSIGSIFSTGLDLYYLVPRQAFPLYNTYITVDVYVYNSATKAGNLPQGSAVGFLQSVIGFFMVVAANLVIKKVDPESSLF